MASPGFYNDNLFRCYPFVPREQPLSAATGFDPLAPGTLLELPESAIVDAGVIVAPAATYADQTDRVYLQSVTRDGDTLALTLGSTATLEELTFVCEVSDPHGTTYWADSRPPTGPSDSSESPDDSCDNNAILTGFLVIGDLAALYAMIPDQSTIQCIPQLWTLEPARIQNLSRAYLQTVSLANMPRILHTPPADCGDTVTQPTEGRWQSRCISGPITWREGFNCLIRQSTINSALIFSASPGAGRGQPCEEVPAYPGEVSPDGGSFLSGGPSCRDIVRAVNGVTGPHLQLLAGAGIRIQADTDVPNSVVVSQAFGDFAACVYDPTLSNVVIDHGLYLGVYLT